MSNENLNQIKKEYLTQDNRYTAYPIFVTVQELHCIGVIADGYSVSCPYGDGETKTKYTYDGLESSYDSKEECFEAMQEELGISESDDEKDKIEELNLSYIWIDRQWFLTVKGAEEYINSNKHNLGKTRTFVHHFDRRNFEMRELLELINFKK